MFGAFATRKAAAIDQGGPPTKAVASIGLLDVALSTTESQQQHYCVPTAFYQLVLGPYLKYSRGDWSDGISTLADREASMLRLVAERAELCDGQRILELGCGWGSLTLWMAERYPNAEIVAVSHSATQKQWIDAQCRERGLNNCQVITQDINEFEAPGMFDRIISVEMFEHVRNYAVLMQRIFAVGAVMTVTYLCTIFATEISCMSSILMKHTAGWQSISSPTV